MKRSGWFNDVVIFRLFDALLQVWRDEERRPSICLIEPLWLPWLRNPDIHVAGLSGAAGYCLELELDKSDYFVTAYNPGQSHWFLVVMDNTGGALILDSIQKELYQYRRALDICREALHRILHLDVNAGASARVWKNWWQQADGHNCGLFTCLALLLFLRHTGLFRQLISGEEVALPPLPQQMLPQLREDLFLFFKLAYPHLNSRNQNWNLGPNVILFQ